MAKKKPIEQPQPRYVDKTLEEMTDSEFLKNVEPMGEPFYFDYLSAPYDSVSSVNGYVSDTKMGMLAQGTKFRVQETKRPVYAPQTTVKSKNYVKKRTVLLLLIMLLALAMVAVIVLGALDLSFGDYFNLYDREQGDISIVDVALSGMEKLTGMELNTEFVVYFEADAPEDLIPPYAVWAATILYILTTALVLIKAFIALFGKRSPVGYFQKRKFGFMAIVMFLCAAIDLVGGMYASGSGIGDFVTFVAPSSQAFGAGFGLYIMAAIPVLILVFSSFAYGKTRKR